MRTDRPAEVSVNFLVNLCHSASVAAGWWHDPVTGQPLFDELNMVPQKIALIHSEISEAFEGFRRDRKDDHLPDRPAIEVELADAMIRILDLAGALRLDLGGALADKMVYNKERADHKTAARLSAGGKKF